MFTTPPDNERTEVDSPESQREPSKPRNLLTLSTYFLQLGAIGFGGPIALAARMQRTLVDERGWFSREEFADGLALSQLSPGPLAAQLAMYLGSVNGGVIGGSVAGIAF